MHSTKTQHFSANIDAIDSQCFLTESFELLREWLSSTTGTKLAALWMNVADALSSWVPKTDNTINAH